LEYSIGLDFDHDRIIEIVFSMLEFIFVDTVFWYSSEVRLVSSSFVGVTDSSGVCVGDSTR